MSEGTGSAAAAVVNDLIWLGSDGLIYVLSDRIGLTESADPGYPGAYSLPEDGSRVLSDAEWAAQNERIRRLVNGR